VNWNRFQSRWDNVSDDVRFGSIPAAESISPWEAAFGHKQPLATKENTATRVGLIGVVNLSH